MTRIAVAFDVDDDVADPADPCGLIDDAYSALILLLVGWGAHDIDVRQTEQ